MATFQRHGMMVESFHNLNVYRDGALRTALDGKSGPLFNKLYTRTNYLSATL